jgi:hypothetical protein
MKTPTWQWIAAAIAGLIMLSSMTTDNDQSFSCGLQKATTRITTDPNAPFGERMSQAANARFGERNQVPDC